MSDADSRLCRRVLVLCAWLCVACPPRGTAAEQFANHALRGMQRVNVAVEGVEPDFARYGLRAEEVRRHVEVKLAAAGLKIADDAAAQRDAAVSQLQVKLTIVENVYAFYSYALGLQARRKLSLGAEGSFIAQNVWSSGESGVINPTDMPRLFEVIDRLLAKFLSAHGADNVATGTATAH